MIAFHQNWSGIEKSPDYLLSAKEAGCARLELVLSIHSQWGPKTCSATEANLGFGDRHRGNAVQLHPLLEVD